MKPNQAFEDLKILVGDWQVTHDHGRISTVNYRMSCYDSVLVETWALKPDVESLTLYHMDGDDFIATHYCPLCNQPKLLYVGGTDSQYNFETQSVTNLSDPDKDHCRALAFKIINRDEILRSETYAENGVETIETGVFSRI